MKTLLAVGIALIYGVASAQTIGVGAVAGSVSRSESTSASLAGANSNNAVTVAPATTLSTSTSTTLNPTLNSNTTLNPSLNSALTIEGTNIPDKTTQSINYSGTTTQRNAPAVVGPVMNPTTPCTSVITGGGSVIGFGIQLGASLEDKECTRREFARVLMAMGQMDAGMSVLCGNEMVAKAAPAICKKVQMALGSTDMLPIVASSTTSAPATQSIATPTASTAKSDGPRAGQVEKGSDGKSYRFNGQGWVPISNDEAQAPAKLQTSQLR